MQLDTLPHEILDSSASESSGGLGICPRLQRVPSQRSKIRCEPLSAEAEGHEPSYTAVSAHAYPTAMQDAVVAHETAANAVAALETFWLGSVDQLLPLLRSTHVASTLSAVM